jgi:hypothetical protein
MIGSGGTSPSFGWPRVSPTSATGVYVTALPLLAAPLTRDPLPVSAGMFAEWLPWLLFGLLAGRCWTAGSAAR